MKKENFKIDDAMLERIEQFAAANKLTKSSAIRLLLARALGDDVELAYIQELVTRIQNVVRGNVGQLLSRWENELVTMLTKTLEISREEVTAQMPPEVAEYERQETGARTPGGRGPRAPAPARQGVVAAPRPAPETPETGTVEFIEPEPEADLSPETGDDERLDALERELEELFWENYRALLPEYENAADAAQEALQLVLKYREEAVSETDWQPPEFGTEDWNERKAAAFPAGGVRGRRR